MADIRPDDDWVALTFIISNEMVDAVTDFCTERGSRGVVVIDDDPAATRVSAYFSRDEFRSFQEDVEAFRSVLGEAFPDLPELEFEVSSLKTENWATMWKDNFTSMLIGDRLIVSPPWLKPDSSGREIIFIEPGEAFGTGTHETTQGCLILLEKAIAHVRRNSDNFNVLDVGCGSAILAIAAVKLGARSALGIDNDPVAIKGARENLLLNQVEHAVRLVCTDLVSVTEPADIVTANLDPKTLRLGRDKLLVLARRFLIISGVPLNQWEEVKGLFLETSMLLEKELTLNEWGAGLFVPSGWKNR